MKTLKQSATESLEFLEKLLKDNKLDESDVKKYISPLREIVNQHNEWIPFVFSEGHYTNVPKDGEIVLVSDGDRVWEDEFYDNGEDGCDLLRTFTCDYETLAWMSLPEPHNLAYALAKQIDQFMYDHDSYKYNDQEDTQSFDSLVEQIEKGEIDGFVEMLTKIADESEIDRDDANRLIDRLRELQDAIKENNCTE